MAEARKARPNDRVDFFSHLLSDKRFDMSDQFLTAQTRTLVLAGSETTATALAGLTYHLLHNPETLRHLTEEVRAAFTDSSQIDADSTAALPYLFAVIEEGLRLFPPVPSGMPRICPGAYIDGHYVPKGVRPSPPPFSLLNISNTKNSTKLTPAPPPADSPPDHRLRPRTSHRPLTSLLHPTPSLLARALATHHTRTLRLRLRCGHERRLEAV